MSDNAFPDQILGGFSFINFPPELSGDQFRTFTRAIDYRLKQVDYVVYTIIQMNPELEPETLYENHVNDYLDFKKRALTNGHFNAVYPSILGVPSNMLQIVEMAKILNQTKEFCKTAKAPVSDMNLLEQFIKEPPYRELSPEETQEKTQRLLDEQERNETLYGQTYTPDTQEKDLNRIVSFKMIEGDPLQIAQYCEESNAIIDIFRLFRLSQKEMLNDWEKKIMDVQLGNVLVLPEHVFDDEQKTGVKDMFEANIVSLLSVYDMHKTMKSLYRGDSVGRMIYEAELTQYFEESQIYLQRLFQLEDNDTAYENVWDNKEPDYFGIISPDEYRAYCRSIPKGNGRYALETIEDDWFVAIPAYSSRHYATGLNDNGRKSFDSVLYKEIRSLAKEYGFDTIPKSVDELRAISLKNTPRF